MRRSADLFELADLAAAASTPDPGDDLSYAWVALLSRSATDRLLDEVIDDLGDRRASLALEVVLGRLLQPREGGIDRPRIMRVRDAALDNLDYVLASRAQRALAELEPEAGLERAILGAIDASGGRFGAAQDSFIACLLETPQDQDLKDQLDAARARRFERYAITQGFGGPRDRQLLRLRRRSERAAPGAA